MYNLPDELLKFIFSQAYTGNGKTYKSILFSCKKFYELEYSEDKVDKLANHFWTIIQKYPEGIRSKKIYFDFMIGSEHTSMKDIERLIDKGIGRCAFSTFEKCVASNPNLSVEFVLKYSHIFKKYKEEVCYKLFLGAKIVKELGWTDLEYFDTYCKNGDGIVILDTEYTEYTESPRSPFSILDVIEDKDDDNFWDYSRHPNIFMCDIENNIELGWRWECIPENPNLTTDFIEKFFLDPKNPKISDKFAICWAYITMHKIVTLKYIDDHPDFPWNFSQIFGNIHLTVDFMKKHRNKFSKKDWKNMSSHQNILMEDIESNLQEENPLPWHFPSIGRNPNLTFRFMIKYRKKIPLKKITKNQKWYTKYY
jgi:hypothetical protein